MINLGKPELKIRGIWIVAHFTNDFQSFRYIDKHISWGKDWGEGIIHYTFNGTQ